MSRCSVAGCSYETRIKRGWCEAHYSKKWRRHGDPLYRRPASATPDARALAAIRAKYPDGQAVCAYCLGPFLRARDHRRGSATCSGACRALLPKVGLSCVVPWVECSCGVRYIKRRGRLHCRPSDAEDYQQTWRRKTGQEGVRVVQCVECGGLFDSPSATRRFCGMKCARCYQGRAARRTPSGIARHKASKRRARYRARGAEVQYPYSREAIFDRDGWACWICGGAVDRGAVVPAYHAPTIDHVIALAVGGEDSAANVRLAHFICNSRRGTGGRSSLEPVA